MTGAKSERAETSARRKAALVTGGARGLGAALTAALLQDGYVVHVGCRDPEAARSRFRGPGFKTGSDVDFRQLDLASFDQIRRFADSAKVEGIQYDLIVNNAGVCNWELQHTIDGYEHTLAVNYLGPYLLTRLLLLGSPIDAPCGVINIGSSEVVSKLDLEIATDGAAYDMARSYALSKTLLVAFTGALWSNSSAAEPRIFCIHPGLLRTRLGGAGTLARLGRAVSYPFAASPTSGAKRVMRVLNSAASSSSSGGYFLRDKQVAYPACIADAATRARVWNWTSEIVGLSHQAARA